jgi:hypothetical protein
MNPLIVYIGFIIAYLHVSYPSSIHIGEGKRFGWLTLEVLEKRMNAFH